MTRARVVYEKHGHVASITLDRPEVLNALDLQTHAELCEIWDDFERDDDMRVGVLSGRGTRAFSVGQDLKELAQRDQAGAAPSSFGSRGRAGWPRLTERFAFSKPVVAKVCGHALGGGFELALACDIVVAADNASFALPEAKLGLIAGAGGLFRLPRQIPAKVAMGHLMTGRPITAERAYALGLVNEVAPLAQVDACVQGWVDDLLRAAPLSLRAIKEVGARSSHLSLEAAFAADYEWEAVRRDSADCKEGPRAFAEKRAPVWRGR